MGCGLSSIKAKADYSIETAQIKPKRIFNLRKYKRANPKYLKLVEDLFEVEEVSPSSEVSFV